MEQKKPYHLQLLREELARRKQKNPQLSLRAFAAKLDVDSGALSSIMNEKRALSLKLGRHLLTKLNRSPREEELFLSSIARAHIQRPLKRRDPQVRRMTRGVQQSATAVIEESLYQMISGWEHAAILELSFREDFKNDRRFIADAFGISPADAQAALDRLFDLGLLAIEDGRVVKKNPHLDGNSQRATNQALRQKQKQIREKAIEAIDNHEPATRYMTTVTMCIDPSLLDEAKRRVDDFNDSLCAFLESGERREVYTMEIGLFSLEKRTQEKLKGVPHENQIIHS